MEREKQFNKPSVLLALALTAAGLLPATDADSTTVQSRLTTTAADPASNVQIYTREDILLSGASHAADFIRHLPSNSFGSYRPKTGSTAQADAAVSLRGSGAGLTLVLVDGRRLPKSPHAPAWQNLNLLPLGAIERIEVMTEGGSALYGADAVGGVINVVTRDDFEGAELMLGTADVGYPRAGGEREEGSLVFGARSDRSRVLAGVSWNDRELIAENDLPNDVSSASVFGNSFTTLSFGADEFNWTSFNTGCDNLGPGFSLVPNSSSLNGSRCAFDPSIIASDEPALENRSLYVKATHQINDTWQLWATSAFSQAESFGLLAPVPDSSFFFSPLPADSPNNPTNPNSPLFDASLGLDPQPVNWWHRFAALGNREYNVTHQLLDFQVGSRAELSGADLEVGFRHSDNRASDVSRNFLLRDVAEAYIADGTYDLGNPFNNPENVLNAMKVTLFREAKYDQDEWFGTLHFGPSEWFGKPLNLVVGAAHMETEYYDQYDPQSTAGLVGGTVGRSAGGDRNTTSLFFKAGMAIHEQLTFNLAARYDDYSDVGSEVSSKFTAVWQPQSGLTVRGTYSQDHSTPDLRRFNSTPEPPEISIIDPFDPVSISEVNPSLQSEQIEQFNIDISYEFSDHWQLGLGFWDLALKDRIRNFGTTGLISLIENNRPIPRGLGCEPDGQGGYSQCAVGYGNGGSLDLSGLTLDVQAEYEVFGGQFNSQLQAMYLDEYRFDGSGNAMRGRGTPRVRSQLNNRFAIGDWVFAYHINHIAGDGDNDDFFYAPSWTSHDVQINYHTPWQGVFTVGARNLGEELPRFSSQINPSSNDEFNSFLFDTYGRNVYARYTQTF
ncbi:TonB-dependent receptor plug domain-containing protein [Marinicella meishanensis]|uniref:TonB-dependent receptor plug domain-containing protein n=1 Tax=Marinicella meishanensis TaxID=2873263 RepID=UPI001CBF439D|nr:TonB-dependent receptor [Marinicella sp. NBU2979]